ncbi:L,D-transpeptidase family protein [Thiomicrorhabdus sp. ZW0627]|uniref:L,D-transpeptidase family protein n=1 Tax=Thiomicrorhabdus sp. ZW0627 TaxID=3039774 RepID=UPI0024364C4E|nr:L,D-transpeptidase family protein [Thiomicrorhabdus sp. ZW0627]MDG6774748.1 L,D-transpeptidase family protein [Thiomicrorhabdus sp. ZW0627]
MIRLISILMIAGMFLTAAQAQPQTIQQQLKAMLSQDYLPSIFGQDDIRLSKKTLLQKFYSQRNYELAWKSRSENGLSNQLLNAINAAEDDGLNPEYSGYHHALLQRLSKSPTPEDQAIQDLLLSDAFMTLGYHLFYGIAFGTEADTLHRAVARKTIDMPAILANALQQGRIESALSQLTPQHRYYRNLKKALQRYRTIADQGGWNQNPEAYSDIENVKKRLSITGELDYDPQSTDSSFPYDYLNTEPIGWSWTENDWEDKSSQNNTQPPAQTSEQPEEITRAIKEFQRCHHIIVDGVIGPQTKNKLAESVQDVILKIRLNLERWRWYSSHIPDRYVMVNIPNFSLQYIADDQVLSMQAVVGQIKRPTPMMEAMMSYLVYNPYWRIPKTILAEDILPKLRNDSTYLNQKKIRLFSATDRTESHPLDATKIDWNKVTKNGMLRYIFRQDSGPKNPLGRIKFMFPNSEDIYIHDTSARYLFKNKAYLVSSGCIRAEKPMQLAYEILVRENSETTYDSIYSQIEGGDRQVVHLKEKIPVFVTYQTAWADTEGRLFLRKDVYKEDANLMSFMKKTLEN